jgi:hypothetical protein
MSYDEVLNKRSYLTLILLNAAIPSVKPFDEQQDDNDEQQDDNDDIDAIAQRASKKSSKKNSYQEVDDVFMNLM